MLQDTDLQKPSRTASTEEVSETILEEEEHVEQSGENNIDREDTSSKSSDNSRRNSPILESSLPENNPVLREVTVSEGE